MSGKDKLKRFTARHAMLEKSMYWYFRWRHGAQARAEIVKRQQASLFDYEMLSAEMPYFPQERVIDNNIYGYAHHLKKFAGLRHDLRAYMEHGLFLGGIVHQDQYHWHFKRIITMSARRRAILAEKLPSRESVAVGPYIHYASALPGNASMDALKKELGKTLLVFPFHSMKNVKARFDDALFLAEIEKRAADFQSVLICMYYIDARDKERVRAYEERGFRVVTAGHKFDPNFVSRQRAHIELADMTMSNGMGTQTGFCIYLQKPHYIFRQQLAQNAHSQKELRRFEESSLQDDKSRVQYERELFAQLFGEWSGEISARQREITADYWGFEDLKSAEELQHIFGT